MIVGNGRGQPAMVRASWPRGVLLYKPQVQNSCSNSAIGGAQAHRANGSARTAASTQAARGQLEDAPVEALCSDSTKEHVIDSRTG